MKRNFVLAIAFATASLYACNNGTNKAPDAVEAGVRQARPQPRTCVAFEFLPWSVLERVDRAALLSGRYYSS